MSRIYLALGLFATSLLVANVVIGLTGGDTNAAAGEYRQAMADLADAERQQIPGQPPSQQLKTAREGFAAEAKKYQPVRSRQTLHFLLGLLAVLVTLLLNSISLTYFLGTGRWCREVTEAYELDPILIDRSKQIKRRNYPWWMMVNCALLAIIILGGASDPSANTTNSGIWVLPHRLVAIAGTCLIASAFLKQVGLVGEHYQLIDEILELVEEKTEQAGG